METAATARIALSRGVRRAKASAAPTPRALTWNLVARIAWVLWATGLLMLFVFSVPLRYNELVGSLAVNRSLSDLGLGTVRTFYVNYSVALEAVFAFLFYTVGIVIFARKSRDWLALYVSLTLVTFGVGAAPILHTLGALTRANPEWTLPVNLLAFVAWSLLYGFTYVFPDGRFVPRWTRWLAAFSTLLLLPWFVLPALSTYNPWNWDPAVIGVLILAIATAPIGTQIYRYLHSTDPQYRRQIKWVVLGLTAASLGTIGFFLPLVDPLLQASVVAPTIRQVARPELLLLYSGGTTLFCLLALLLPFTMAVSIFRYRLWAIDIILTRTLVYVPLTAILAGTYTASVTLFQKAFVAVTGDQSDAAVVLSTLILASMFTPIKNALQTIVDRRFKEKVDPTRGLQEFADQVSSVVQVLDRRRMTSKLLDEATGAFGAHGGAIYLGADGHVKLVHGSDDWHGEAKISVPLARHGVKYGMVVLGPRKDGQEYSDADREVLKGVVDTVAGAIEIEALRQ